MKTLILIGGICLAWLVTDQWQKNKCGRWFGQNVP